jgi:hypothetical protein
MTDRYERKRRDIDPEVEVMCAHVYAATGAMLAVLSLVVSTFLFVPLLFVIFIPHPDLIAQSQKAISEGLKFLLVMLIIGVIPLGCELIKRL